MGIFGTSSSQSLEADIEKATSEKNTVEKWDVIMNICDKVTTDQTITKECLKLIIKRLNHQDPHVVMQAITLLDACVNNCRMPFHLEVASRDFENEFKRLLHKSQPKVATKLKLCLKKWAEEEFKSDSALNLIPSLYQKLKSENVDFSDPSVTPKREVVLSKDPNVVSSQQEEDDIAKAIELSLKEKSNASPKMTKNETSSASSSLYPSALLSSAPAQEPRKVRALYDFEAAEDNEMTFKAGEVLLVLDDSDTNWWKGQNHRGEGLFPSNFVTADLSAEPENLSKVKKNVQFTDEAASTKVEEEKKEQQLEIDEMKVDRLLHLLHEADPEDPSQDSPEMLNLEHLVNQMGPLIDSELERVDRKHAQLTKLSTDLVDAINLYHSLMRDDRSMMMGPGAYGGPGSSSSMSFGQQQMGAQHQPSQSQQPMYSLPGVFTHQMPNMYQMQQQQHHPMAGPNSMPHQYGQMQLRNEMPPQMNNVGVQQFPTPPGVHQQQQGMGPMPPQQQTAINGPVLSQPPSQNQQPMQNGLPHPGQQQMPLPPPTTQFPQTHQQQQMPLMTSQPISQQYMSAIAPSIPTTQQQQRPQNFPQPGIPQTANIMPGPNFMPYHGQPPMTTGIPQYPGNMNIMHQGGNMNSPQNIPIYQQQR